MKGLTSNQLKVIAIITMILDHIGYYFYYDLDSRLYICLRIIGRIAMPLFVFLIVQGFFNTKDFKKYMIRLFNLAIVTQIVISVLGYINNIYCINYNVDIYKELNIVFSFFMSLLFIYFINNIKLINEKGNILNNIMNILFLIVISLIYLYIKIDYSYFVPILALTFYIAEKVKRSAKTENKYINMYLNIIMYTLITIVIISFSLYKGNLYIFTFLSLPFIYLYSGKLGKKSIRLRNMFYYIFPIQHAILYSIAMLIYSNY